MPFYLLTDLSSGKQVWDYEFLLMRALAGQSVKAMMGEFRQSG